MTFNEYGTLKRVALRSATDAYIDQAKADREWVALRYRRAPDVVEAAAEFQAFRNIIESSGAECVMLAREDTLTLDSIYVRDASIVSPSGLILCHMGRDSRRGEPFVNAAFLESHGASINGVINTPGTVEGGDFIWIDDHTAVVGLGPRTNKEGTRQLGALLGKDVDLHVVRLPQPDHPEDVFHLMSMISPLDKNLALIYRPLMPPTFTNWLEARGISLIEVPENEFLPMGCNVLALGPRHCLMLDGLPLTKERLEAAGCRVRTYKGDEISRKGEGGPTCLTRPLERASPQAGPSDPIDHHHPFIV